MATQEVITKIEPAQSVPVVKATQSYLRPLATVATLFFMWGFLTCLNDILVPHLKSIFDLSYARVMLVQFAFFSAYFLFSVPWSRFVNSIGYQGARLADHGIGSIPVCTRRIRCFLPAVPECAPHSCHRDNWPSGGC